MAIGNVSKVSGGGQAPALAVFADLVELDLDNSYVTGGYTGLSDTLAAVIGKGRTILGLIQVNYPTAHFVEYVASTDALMVKTEALVEVSGATDLSGVTDLRLLVISI